MKVRDARFNTTELSRLKQEAEFDYDRNLHVETLWWDRLIQRIQQYLEELFGTKAGNWAFGHIHWAILIIAIGLLLYFLRKHLFHGGFAPEAVKAGLIPEIGEDIQRTDLDRLLAAAEYEGHWRLALRYQYLQVLRYLVDEGRIRYQPESTDRDYAQQLKDQAQRNAFRELSFLFKWAWYGDAPMNQSRYWALAPEFTRFRSTPAKA